MEEKNALINEFYVHFFVYLSVVIVIAIAIVLLIIFRRKIQFDRAPINKLFFFLIIGILVLANVFFGFRFALCCLDFKAIQNEKFEITTGTVVGYAKAYENANGTISYASPIVKIEGSDQTVILKLRPNIRNLSPVNIDQKYTFIYLKYTKLAKVIT